MNCSECKFGITTKNGKTFCFVSDEWESSHSAPNCEVFLPKDFPATLWEALEAISE